MVFELIQILKNSRLYKDQITHHEKIPPKKPIYKDAPFPLEDEISEYLTKKRINSLYSHQSYAFEKIAEGKNIAAVTPTASGKTLIYNIPVVESILRDPSKKALYIFPLKALEQDQFKIINELCTSLENKMEISSAVYDGDTKAYRRKKIRENPPHILITNPDMLHTGILPNHPKWIKFLASLKYVVLDETHTYRGVFGSHMTNLIRRLKRIAAFYGSRIIFICCSATIGNPLELAEGFF